MHQGPAAQGLPYAVAGIGDMLALFRCISCKYTFSTTTDVADLLGAPGRVFATGEVRAVVGPAIEACTTLRMHRSGLRRPLGGGLDNGCALDRTTGTPCWNLCVDEHDRACVSCSQPEFLSDVQQCSKAVYMRVEEATQCAIRRCMLRVAFSPLNLVNPSARREHDLTLPRKSVP